MTLTKDDIVKLKKEQEILSVSINNHKLELENAKKSIGLSVEEINSLDEQKKTLQADILLLDEDKKTADKGYKESLGKLKIKNDTLNELDKFIEDKEDKLHNLNIEYAEQFKTLSKEKEKREKEIAKQKEIITKEVEKLKSIL